MSILVVLKKCIFYQKQNVDGIFSSVNDEHQLLGTVPSETLVESVVFEKARAFEAKIGYTINKMVFAHRHLGRGYFTWRQQSYEVPPVRAHDIPRNG